MPDIITDPHAHLGHIAQRLGIAAVKTVLDLYEESSEAFILDIGTKPGDLKERRLSFGGYRCVKFSAGLWPGRESFAKPRASLAYLEEDLQSGDCVALGECGLDYHHMEALPDQQKAIFRSQALLAIEYRLPLIVHSRDAYMDTLEIVAETALYTPVVIHCFGYGPKEGEKFLSAGCHLSFAGNISYKNAGPLREAFRLCPMDRVLCETDAPYMNSMPHRGKASTSLDLSRTVDVGAELKGIRSEDLSRQTSLNAQRLFGLKTPRASV
ncbi:MAG: TatD DNase family protein [Spirochaetes bacterium]|nr:MAG: TatD DNase family protein [Spirochaetota bacterium]